MPMSLARQISTARSLAGLNQAALARLMGVSPARISEWEAGKYQPSAATLARIASALNTTVDALMSGKPNTGGPSGERGRDTLSLALDAFDLAERLATFARELIPPGGQRGDTRPPSGRPTPRSRPRLAG